MKESEGGELVENTIWEGGESVVAEGTKGMRVWWWMEWDVDGKVFEVDVVVEDVWRKGGELIVIEEHEWEKDGRMKREWEEEM